MLRVYAAPGSAGLSRRSFKAKADVPPAAHPRTATGTPSRSKRDGSRHARLNVLPDESGVPSETVQLGLSQCQGRVAQMERSAGLRPAAARSAERAQEIPWVFERLNVLRLTEPRSAVTEIDLSNTPSRCALSFGRCVVYTTPPAGACRVIAFGAKAGESALTFPPQLLGAATCLGEAVRRRKRSGDGSTLNPVKGRGLSHSMLNARSRDSGACSRVNGACSRVNGACSRVNGACSRDSGACSRVNGARSRVNGACSRVNGAAFLRTPPVCRDACCRRLKSVLGSGEQLV